MSARALVLRGDALSLPLPDESVDLIVSSPPYFALRSYRDGDEHYAGQIGSEPTPQAFLEALWAVLAEAWRVLKPSGSCFINLGDKRAGSGGHNNSNLGATSALSPHAKAQKAGNGPRMDRALASTSGSAKGSTLEGRLQQESNRSTRRNAPDRYNQAAFGRPKSKMLLPHRFAIGCEDGLADPEGKGWVVRSDIVWQKLNGLPESVTDRCRDSHEYVFHLTKSERYFAAVDEVREDYAPATSARYVQGYKPDNKLADAQLSKNTNYRDDYDTNPLGKLPGSVWPLPSEPLVISDEVKAHYDLPDHFAAFPTELVRRIILGWSPSGVCVECGEGRRPVVAKGLAVQRETNGHKQHRGGDTGHAGGIQRSDYPTGTTEATVIGYACSCTPRTEHPERRRPTSTPKREDLTRRPAEDHRGSNTFPPPGPPVVEYSLEGWTAPPTRPAVVLDIFGGTGTTAGVARALGRIGVSVDLSHDYSRLADYLIHRSGRFAKVVQRTHRDNQGSLL